MADREPVIVRNAEVRIGVVKVEEDDGTHTWTAYCSGPGCGTRSHPGHVTSAWPTKEIAAKRIRQHLEEHRTGVPSPELSQFLSDNGLQATGDGRTVRQVGLPDGAEDVTDKAIGLIEGSN